MTVHFQSFSYYLNQPSNFAFEISTHSASSKIKNSYRISKMFWNNELKASPLLSYEDFEKKERLREEMREKIREELKVEMREEVREEIRGEIGEDMRENIIDEILDSQKGNGKEEEEETIKILWKHTNIFRKGTTSSD